MKILKKIEDAFAAVAFAEAGEFDTAREMVKEDTPQTKATQSGYSEGSGHSDINEQPSKA